MLSLADLPLWVEMFMDASLSAQRRDFHQVTSIMYKSVKSLPSPLFRLSAEQKTIVEFRTQHCLRIVGVRGQKVLIIFLLEN